MYNGIGLPTARGSGTNAYVQRNLAFIAVSTKKVGYRTEDDLQRSEARLNKKPNPEILEHERKRKVELKCLELRDLMEGQGYAEEEVEEKVSLYRKLLLEQLAENPADFVIEYDAHGKAVYADGHHKTELMNEKNARLRRALKISDDYVPGAAFKGMCDPSKVMPGKIAPDSADCAANGPEAMAKKKEKECEDVSSLSDSSSDSESGSSDSSSSSSSDSDSSSDSSKSSSSSSSRGRLSRKSGRKRDLRSRKCSEPKARKTKHHSRRSSRSSSSDSSKRRSKHAKGAIVYGMKLRLLLVASVWDIKCLLFPKACCTSSFLGKSSPSPSFVMTLTAGSVASLPDFRLFCH
uniref:Cwf21 domain-containing protein n=1 Tax=Trichuris muris TaxID=70415 RepID=A0A5S6Q2E8_TRIMR